MGDVNIGDQTRHRQLEKRLAEVCESQANLKSVNVDDYDFWLANLTTPIPTAVNQNQHSYRTWNSSSFTKDFFFLNFCNFQKTSSIIYFQFYILEWETQALVLANYWSFWNMKGFLIFGQFLVILIGLSVYAPLYRVRRNPEKRFLIPGLQTIRKSDEIGAIERIKYEIAHFNELFYFLVIAVRIILAKGMVFNFLWRSQFEVVT